MALRKILETRSASPYYKPPPLHIQVVGIKEVPRVLSWDFSNDTATPVLIKKNVSAAITDGCSVSKLTLYEEFASKVKEGGNYVIRGYALRGSSPPYSILITRDTIIFKSSPVAVAEGLKKEALLLLDGGQRSHSSVSCQLPEAS